MDEKDLHMLEILSEEKNITQTAKRLFFSQPALSSKIKQLEKEFGCNIIVRGPKGISFTVQGEMIIRYAHHALADLADQNSARSRRNQLFDHARQTGCNKLALGHHRDDIIETFLLNLTRSGNISTMAPRQDLFDGRLSLIRPLAYLDKQEIVTIGEQLQVTPIRPNCPLAEKTQRLEMHQLAEMIYERIPGAKKHMFAALGNVRQEYLLKQSGGRRP